MTYYNPDVMAPTTIPVGGIIPYSDNAPPAGFLECDGSAISRTTYANLFAIIGVTWGAGDGVTTFNIPDSRGEFLRGWDNGRGVDAGRAFATAQAQDVQPHTHLAGGAQVWLGAGALDIGNQVNYSGGRDRLTSSTGTVETRPRNVDPMYIIKY